MKKDNPNELNNQEKVSILLKEYEQLFQLLFIRAEIIEKRTFYALTGYGIILTTIFATTKIENLEKFSWVLAIYIPVLFTVLINSTLNLIISFDRVREGIINSEQKINELAGSQHLLDWESNYPTRKLIGGNLGKTTLILQFSIGLLAFGLNGFLGFLYQTKYAAILYALISGMILILNLVYVFTRIHKEKKKKVQKIEGSS